MTNQLKPLSLLLLLLFTSVMAHAQKGVFPGFIVTIANDTLWGELKGGKEHQMTKIISFKADNADEFTDYTPSQIKAFGLGGDKLFAAKEVQIGDQKHKAFLKVLVDGPVSLYFSESLSTSGKFYVQKAGEQTLQLHNTYYLGILGGFFSDCESMATGGVSANRRRYAYNAYALAAAIHEYNTCRYSNQQSTILVQQRKLTLKKGVRVGGHTSTMTYNSDVSPLYGKNFGWTSGVSAGFFLNISNGKRLSLQPEILYTSRRADQHFDEPSMVPGASLDRAVKLEAHYIQLPVLLQYSFGSGNIQPYINGGLSYSYAFSRSYTQTFTRSSDGVSFSDDPEINSYTIGYLAGAGLAQKLNSGNSLLLEVRMNRDMANTNFLYQKINFTSFMLSAGVIF